VQEERQATARAAAGPENKGAEAARAAIATVKVLRALGGRGPRSRRRPR
jgi:6,7-dimethyl-8-ribityllumazine synthase